MSDRPPNPLSRKLRLVGVVLIAVAIGLAALYAAWRIRRESLVRGALAEGTAAYEQGDWNVARRMLGRYLAAHPDDVDVLVKYARAQLRVRPLPIEAVRQAIAAYRQILRNDTEHDEAFKRLALLYESTANYAELELVAQTRAAAVPDDPAATLVEARALIFRRRPDEARQRLESLLARLESRPDLCEPLAEASVMLSALAVESVPAGGDSAREDEARRVLDRALERCPREALPLLQRAALPRLLARQAVRDPDPAALEVARRDLEAAEGLTLNDPRLHLALCEEWLTHREYERARAQLETARGQSQESLEPFVVDPDDWTAACFRLGARLALLTSDPAGGQLARDILARLADRPQRVDVLPQVVELLLAANALDEARAALDAFVDATQAMTGRPELAEQTAYLRALVARGAGKPYEVITLLEPLAGRPGDRAPAIRGLLAEAYARTGQGGRLVQSLGGDNATLRRNPAVAKAVVRAALERGDLERARAILSAAASEAESDLELRVLKLGVEMGVAMQEGASEALARLSSELDALVAAHPRRADLRVLRAGLAERRGDPAAAEAELLAAGADVDEPLAATLPLARLYARLERLDDAEVVLRAACERFVDRPAGWIALSDLLADQRRVDEARAVLARARAAQTQPESVQQVVAAQALLEFREGQRAAGVALLREQVRQDPGDAGARAMLLGVTEVLADDESAQRLVDELKQIEGESGLQWRLHQARLWLTMRDWQARQAEAEKLLKACLEADPRWVLPALVLGGLYERVGDPVNAELVYANAFRVSGATEPADRLLALYQRQRRFSDAREVLTRLERRMGEEALGTRRLLVALGEGQLAEAIQELELKAAGAERDPSDLLRLASLNYARSRDARRALELADQAAQAGADPTEVARVRAWVLREDGRDGEGAAVLDELIAQHPKPEAYLLRANYNAAAGRHEAAQRDYEALAGLVEGPYGPAILGEYHAQRGELDVAIGIWQDALVRDPNALPIKRGLTKALLKRGAPGDREQAQRLLSELQSALPSDTDLLWVAAAERASAGTPEAAGEAQELLRRAVKAPPASLEVHRGLCQTALGLGDFAVARELAVAALRSFPGDPALLTMRARAELELGELATAEQIVRPMLADRAVSLEVLELAADLAMRRGDQATLTRVLGSVLAHLDGAGNVEAGQVVAARVRIALGRLDEARTALEEFLAGEDGRESVAARVLLADVLRRQREWTAAASQLDDAAALDPAFPPMLATRVALLVDQERFDELGALVDSAAVASAPVSVQLTAASALAGSPGHLPRAIRAVERATQADPQATAAWGLLGELRYQQGDAAGAEQAFREVLRRDPRQPDALNNLAWIIAEQHGGSDEAVRLVQQAISQRPDSADFRDTLGFVLARLGRLEEARAEFRRCLEMLPRQPGARTRALLRLAQVSADLQDWGGLRTALSELDELERQRPLLGPDERRQVEELAGRAAQGR